MKAASRFSRHPFDEYFTPSSLVRITLDLLPGDLWSNPSSSFVENSCGDGNFVEAIVRRRYKALGATPAALRTALTTIFAWDIQAKHIYTCRLRLLKFVWEVTQEPTFVYEAMAIVNHHVTRRNSLKNHHIPNPLSEDQLRAKIAIVKEHNGWDDVVAELSGELTVVEEPIPDLIPLPKKAAAVPKEVKPGARVKGDPKIKCYRCHRRIRIGQTSTLSEKGYAHCNPLECVSSN